MTDYRSFFHLLLLYYYYLENLPLIYVRGTLDAELVKYIAETYPKGICSVYCINGKDTEGLGADFEFVVVISAARHSPQNFWCVK